MKILNEKWLEMSYNRYSTSSYIFEDDYYKNINNILEYRDFEEDDYSEESKP